MGENIMEKSIEQIITEKVNREREAITGLKGLIEETEEMKGFIPYLRERKESGMIDKLGYFDNATRLLIDACRAMEEKIDASKELIEKNKHFYNVNLDVLLDAIGKKLDSKYSSRWGYRKTPVVNIETFEREEEEDDFTYTIYTQTAKAGFKTKHPHKSFMLPVVCLGDTEYIRSKNYIMAEEHINLLGDRNNIGLIGIEDGEFASPEWQDVFWKVYRDHLLNIAYQMQSQVDSREDRLALEEQLIKEFGE